MTQIDEAEAIQGWLGALRRDVESTPSAARRRISARLASSGAAVTLASGASVAAATVKQGLMHSAWFGVLVGLPVGLSLGGGAHALFSPDPPAHMASARPAAQVAPAVAGPATVPAVDTPPPPPLAVAPPVVAKATAPTSAPALPNLERELALLEQARTRLAEGAPSAALELVRRHRVAYPSSALEQEREALSVRALLSAGRHDEARRRGDAFSERYPNSVLRPSLERALEAIP